ncbi:MULTISPECIES: enoyl-CoA hydratase-related protein [Candidatus Ichthyocystis]|uniref:Enoyl-CoA hydratase n=1 Tax=Candidatus Ichthyocystis hellenicum TaxID=1561003 RepID=A0A0S4M129_9BURK|nr:MULTISPECIES: enoyl-CoA hydratase-related protein [Ichthyocystis]CUT17479.1 enoyl-CoA hydratase [Candidatus Ichthyocystis hellenicum]
MTENLVLFDKREKYAILRLNRPETRNALNSELLQELSSHLLTIENDSKLHCAILTGHEKFFASGADIEMMRSLSHSESFLSNFISDFDPISSFRKPLIAAVSGYALGAGCELALMCDIILAADSARFGQPEVNLGIIPGAGGTQRLGRSIGKAKTMDMCMSARILTAEEADIAGLVSRVIPDKDLITEAEEIAQKLGSLSLPVLMKIKSSVINSYETSLFAGTHLERQLFYSCFSTHDQKEGMSAFLEKRSPEFHNE